MVLSSDTASPYGSASTPFDGNLNDSCTCQCNDGLPIFREDLGICVDNIQGMLQRLVTLILIVS